MEVVKQPTPTPEPTPKQLKAQKAFQERGEVEWTKYMDFLKQLVDGYVDTISGIEGEDKEIYDALNNKWRMKSSAIAKFNKYIRPVHQLFEMTIAEMKEDKGIPLSQYVTGLENKLREISDSWHTKKEDKEAFYVNVHEVLTRKIAEDEIKEESEIDVKL